jgi:hypothetical protein
VEILSTAWETSGVQGIHRCQVGVTSSHEHHLRWLENKISALYFHHDLFADAGEEMHGATPFFVGKLNSHPGVLVQESTTLTGAGPGNEESGSGSGNETAHSEKNDGLHGPNNPSL